LRSPQRFCGYPHLAHGVVLDAVFGVLGHEIVPLRRGVLSLFEAVYGRG
jgi:hypothetical protein